MERLHNERTFESKESASLYQSAERLKEEYKNRSTKDLILAVGKFIKDHAHSLPEQHKVKNIIESRFMPAEEAFNKGVISCGSIVNMSAEMLRHIGFKVKLIHGECEEMVDHAWISVFDPTDETWVEYDLTRKDGNVPHTHKIKLEVHSWDEIKDQIIEDDRTFRERREERNLSKTQEKTP